MTPYYQDDLVTLYHGDCREALERMSDDSVDCVITDPPYSERTHVMARSGDVHAPAGGRALSGHAAKFSPLDDQAIFDLFGELGRVSRRWVISNLDYRHAFHLEQDPPVRLQMLRIGVWVKTNPMPIFSGDRPAQGWEAIAYLHRVGVKPTWNGGGKHGNHVGPKSQSGEHPTQKPLALVSEWVRRFTSPGDLVLDPFAGSGTTLRAAKDEGRRSIGVELEERYCEIAAKRLAQDTLFGGVA
jgi:site-specific DNA-methyltransferase (adenine-specific)